MYLDFPGANSSPDEEPEDQQRPGWCQVNFFHSPTVLKETVAGAPSESYNRELQEFQVFNSP